jgi:hypothetical protein
VTPVAAATDKTVEPAGKDVPSVGDTDTDTDTSGDLDADVDAVADEDDDWPTRYSWLDDEEADEAIESDDVALESDDAVAAEVEASDPPKPTSPDGSKSPKTKADGEEATAKHADPDEADPDEADAPETETAASPAAHAALEGTDAADEAPVLSSAPDLDPGEIAEAEPAAEAAEPTPEDDEPSDEDEPLAQQDSSTKLVTVVPGVPRYHEPDCILIRFMPEGDVQTRTIPEAKAVNCTPCVACQPED